MRIASWYVGDELITCGGFCTWAYPNSWMVYFMENPLEKMDLNWAYPQDLGNLPMESTSSSILVQY